MSNKKLMVERRRKGRIRKSIRAKSKGRVRLQVFRSNQHIYAQLIDDNKGVTLAQASTLDKDAAKLSSKSNIDAAKLVGNWIAERANKIGVKEVVFDRGPFLYHGRVAAVAEGAREQGLLF